MLRQNPHNVLEWQKRVTLYEGQPKMVGGECGDWGSGGGGGEVQEVLDMHKFKIARCQKMRVFSSYYVDSFWDCIFRANRGLPLLM